MDFEVESKVYSHNWLQYKYFQEEDHEIISCWHRSKNCDHDPIAAINGEKGQWNKVFLVETTPRSLDYINSFMDDVYTDSSGKLTPIFTKFSISGYKSHASLSWMINGTSIRSVNDSNDVESNTAASVEDIIKALEDYYPALKEDVSEVVKLLKLFPPQELS